MGVLKIYRGDAFKPLPDLYRQPNRQVKRPLQEQGRDCLRSIAVVPVIRRQRKLWYARSISKRYEAVERQLQTARRFAILQDGPEADSWNHGFGRGGKEVVEDPLNASLQQSFGAYGLIANSHAGDQVVGVSPAEIRTQSFQIRRDPQPDRQRLSDIKY